MTTSTITVNDSEWTLVLDGAGIIQLNSRGHIHVHIGTVSPPIDTDAYHSVNRGAEIEFSYSGTENVYCMNGAPGDIALIHTRFV